MDKSRILYIFLFSLMVYMFSCQQNMPYKLSDEGIQNFITDYEKVVEPLMTYRNQAEWDAYTTGKKEFFDATTTYSLQIETSCL